MVWWQLLLAAWACGAVGAWPANYEIMAQSDDTGSLTVLGAVVVAVLGAATWPIAWLWLAYMLIRDARR